MHVTFYGTRGSIPVSHLDKVQTGGNTTCLKIESACLPEGHWLLNDAGTGIVPAATDFMINQGKEATIMQTHWHHDHTQGFLLSAFPFVKHIPVTIYGPKERGIGGKQVFQTLMKPPYFPVDFDEVASHLVFHDIEHPNADILVFHPIGGRKKFKLDEFERLVNTGKQLTFDNKQKFDVSECLVIRMHRSNHPEQTISYRFEERPTGQVFVFVTDHENQDGIPKSFREHLSGADLLVLDVQYTREKYDTMTAGFGHGTPDYAARLAQEIGVPFLGHTHHDPASTDRQIKEIVGTAQLETQAQVFACQDYLKVDIGNLEESINNNQ